MSYCRWSSDGFQCDVYAYESCYGGFVVHIANSRRKKRVCDIDWRTPEDFRRTIDQQRRELDDPENELLPIGGPYDGKTFSCDTLEEFLEILIDVKKHGYNVPDVTISAVQEEITEENSCNS